MHIALINPPHTAIGSRIPREHLPPLGLLCGGGPLLDAGKQVKVIDGELAPLSLEQIVQAVAQSKAGLAMIGHSGSSSVHATVLQLCVLLKKALPWVRIVYGGVHPTYHRDEILAEGPDIHV